MKFFIAVCVAALLLLGLLPSCGQPNLVIEAVNNTSETLFVYVVYNPPLNGQKEIVGQVAPDSTIVKDLKNTYGVVHYITVKAENSGGHVVFSREFSRDLFVDIGGQVMIPPLLAIEVTNNTSEALFVYVIHNPPGSGEAETIGEVVPGATIQKYLGQPPAAVVYMSVVAKNSRGDTVYSRQFYRSEFSVAPVQVTITPSQ